jgi:hypothetical protein|tara:strand:+ start:764 stop:970 length:207 start_codon:yes stop_codon:yes gene_type:complete
MNEIEVRKQQREMEKEKGQLDLKRELEESNRVAENTAAQQARYKAKFKVFSDKYDKKNDWYQENIIKP